MEFDDIETIVRRALDDDVGSYRMDRMEDGGYLYLTLRHSQTETPSPAATRTACIWNGGTEAFFLDLSNGYTYREFEWEAEAQPDAVRLLSKLATAYLQGCGCERTIKDRFLGRSKHYFDVEADGEVFSFSR